MSMSDPIADMLTRIRNALKVRQGEVEMPSSKMKEEISRILRDEGFIKDFKVTKAKDQAKKTLKLMLKYGPNNENVITGLRRISKPSLRVYAPHGELPRVMGGLGIAIMSTSKGVLTEKQSRVQNVGGEIICYIW